MDLNRNKYDQRLFKSGIRKYLHEKRFLWLREQAKNFKHLNSVTNPSVIEIGCFNCRSLKYLGFVPSKYYGLDAGWEKGIEEAIQAYPQHTIKKSTNPADICEDWDLCLALETLEHLPRPDVLDQYLSQISKHSRKLIATVPMEIGPLFALKYIYKKIFLKYKHPHTLLEFYNQTLGRCHLVNQDNHCGFDYRSLVNMMNRYFKIEKIEGLNPKLPKLLNTQIGIVASSRFKT